MIVRNPEQAKLTFKALREEFIKDLEAMDLYPMYNNSYDTGEESGAGLGGGAS